MSLDAKIVADSISPDGVRLTTFQATIARFTLAEWNTHRLQLKTPEGFEIDLDNSRNSASSRAIPTEQNIARVEEDPFVPKFAQRVKGMGVGEEMVGELSLACRETWLAACQASVAAAKELNRLNVDKSRANRLLEPFGYHTIVISGTEWEHFFGLRNHPGAQPEFREVAEMMQDQYQNHSPQELDYGWWHLPYIREDELMLLCDYRKSLSPTELADVEEQFKLVSARRCARVSWDKAGEGEPWDEAIGKANGLKTNGHVSPMEHQARPIASALDLLDAKTCNKIHMTAATAWRLSDTGGVDLPSASQLWSGNYRGWFQFRKEIPWEDRFDKILLDQASVSG